MVIFERSARLRETIEFNRKMGSDYLITNSKFQHLVCAYICKLYYVCMAFCNARKTEYEGDIWDESKYGNLPVLGKRHVLVWGIRKGIPAFVNKFISHISQSRNKM